MLGSHLKPADVDQPTVGNGVGPLPCVFWEAKINRATGNKPLPHHNRYSPQAPFCHRVYHRV